jgi:hypothetical protein
MDKALVAQRVASRLFAMENAVDAAILEASQLMTACMEARREVGFAATLGTEAVSKIATVLAELSEARQACVAAHHELNDAKLRLGVRTRMIGTGPKGYAGETEDEANVVHRLAANG